MSPKNKQPRARATEDDEDHDDGRRKKPKKQQVPAEESEEEEEEEEGSSAPEVSTSEDEDSGTTSGGSSEDEDDDDDEDDSSSSSGEGEDGKGKKEIRVDFRFFEPADRDFHGLRALLGSYLDGKGYDVGGLVDAVIAQGPKGDGIGSVVRAIDAGDGGGGGGGKKAAAAAAAGPSTGGGGGGAGAEAEEDDDKDDPADPIAVVTAVGLEGYRAAPFAAGVREFLLARAEAAGKRAAFEAAWDAPGAALLLNERLVNCPPQIAPPLVQCLFEEIERARAEEARVRDELAAAAAPPPTTPLAAACGYAFDRYVLLTRVYEDSRGEEGEDDDDEDDADEDEDEPGKGKGQKQRKKAKAEKKMKGKKQATKPDGGGGGGAPVLVYTRPEDRFFHARSTASFTFPVEGRPVARGELRPLRLALVLPASEVPAARRELDSAVGNARAMPPPPPPAIMLAARKNKGKA